MKKTEPDSALEWESRADTRSVLVVGWCFQTVV